MAFEEKRAWIMVLVTVSCYAVYLGEVLDGPVGPLAGRRYAVPLLWTVGAAIVGSIVLHILASAIAPEGANVKDQRDREIHRFGVYVGQSFVVLGGVTALLLTMAGSERFWIANVLYLGFVLSGLLGAAAKIVAYRLGLPRW
jgi:hypothetical protein